MESFVILGASVLPVSVLKALVVKDIVVSAPATLTVNSTLVEATKRDAGTISRPVGSRNVANARPALPVSLRGVK